MMVGLSLDEENKCVFSAMRLLRAASKARRQRSQRPVSATRVGASHVDDLFLRSDVSRTAVNQGLL